MPTYYNDPFKSIQKFDPDQPRDSDGKWSGGGGGDDSKGGTDKAALPWGNDDPLSAHRGGKYDKGLLTGKDDKGGKYEVHSKDGDGQELTHTDSAGKETSLGSYSGRVEAMNAAQAHHEGKEVEDGKGNMGGETSAHAVLDTEFRDGGVASKTLDVKNMPKGYTLHENERSGAGADHKFVLRGPDKGNVYVSSKASALRAANHLSSNNLNTNLQNVGWKVLSGGK